MKLPNATKEHPNGTAFGYEWDFSDGSPPASGRSASKVTHAFARPGTYTVSLKLSSDYGAFTPAPATVIVTPAEGLAPHAQFTVTSPPGAQPAVFDASSSTPGTCRTIAYYLWNWGDGTALESDNPQLPVLTHTYASPGVYKVTLTVVNSRYQSAVSAPQTVSVSAPDQPPVLAETLPPLIPATPLPVIPPAPDRSPTRVLVRASFAGGVLRVGLSCPAAKVSCAGTAQVETTASFVADAAGARKRAFAKVKAAPKRSRLVIGGASFELAGGRLGTVTVRLTSRARALLRKLRRLPALVIVAAHDSIGDPGATTTPIALDVAGLSLHGAPPKRSR